MPQGKYFDRIIDRLSPQDKSNVQAYVLRQVKEKGFFQTVFNTIQEGIIIVDRNLMIRYANRAAIAMLGIPENIEEQKIGRFLKDVDWTSVQKTDHDGIERISRQEIEVLYPTRRILLFYVLPHEKDKDTSIIIMHDVTEARASTMKKMESEKTQMISLLAAGVAHEIGNPLNSLNIHLQLLGRKLKRSRKKDDEAIELLSVAEKEVKRLDMIISQFLQALRPAMPVMARVDLKQLIVETLNFMRHEIESRNINVECSWADACPGVQGDADQLKQAFYNIIKNAIQAMPDGGTIHISCTYDEEKIEISFADSGKGISAEDIAGIFEPYFTTKRGGTGLGLMVVERIIREHGAELSVDSSTDKGTVFKIRFPIAAKRIRMLPAAPSTEKIKN